jgi:predicted nucleic acid-binding protein
MKILIDTNVVLDDILDRFPNSENAQKISRLVTDEHIRGYLTANCITDIFYIVAKSRDEAIAKKTIKNLLLSFEVVGVDGQDCQKALDTPMRDFEDALAVICAEKEGLDYIVTNDKGFLNQTDLGVSTINPADFILQLGDKSILEKD